MNADELSVSTDKYSDTLCNASKTRSVFSNREWYFLSAIPCLRAACLDLASSILLSNEATKNSSIEEILGIEKSWDKDRIKKHLTTEFQKWNNRYSTLKEGEERNNAQLMLNKIAEARKKYDI